MSESIQKTVFGEQIEEQIRIETTGRVIRPFKRMFDPWGGRGATEYRLDVDSGGIHVDYINPSNTAKILLDIEKDAFDTYDVEETKLGASSDILGSALQHARYGRSTDDTLEITAGGNQLQTTVHREIAESDARITERANLIDPDSLRQSGTIDVDRDELPAEISMSGRDFGEIESMLDGSAAVTLKADSGSVSFRQESDVEKRDITLETGEGEAESMYAVDYFEQLATMFNVGYVDDVTLRWADEFPMFATFEREDVYSGEVMIAPRVQEVPDE